MESPSEQLAKLVVSRLLEKNIIIAASSDKLIQHLASGKMRAEDWRLEIEKAMPQGPSK